MERLKQKVVSSSSRVIASLQQVARHPSFSDPPTSSQQAPHTVTQVPATSHRQQPPVPQVVQAADESSSSSRGLLYQQQQQEATGSTQAAGSTSSPATAGQQAPGMLTSDATAHLTEQEREILLEVFKKEEQFQRETIKQMRNQLASGTQSGPQKESSGGTRKQQEQANLGRPSSSLAYTSRHHQLPRATPEGSRAASACGQLASQLNKPEGEGEEKEKEEQKPQKQCRICRKLILPQEPSHLCSACRQFVCDDCASYSSSNQHWTCSSCRRRATQPGIPADALKELGLNQNSSAVRRMTLRLNRTELRQAAMATVSLTNQPQSISQSCRRPSSVSSLLASHKLTCSSPGGGAPAEAPSSRKPELQASAELGQVHRPTKRQAQHERHQQQRRPSPPAGHSSSPVKVPSRSNEASQTSDSNLPPALNVCTGAPQARSTDLVCHQYSQTVGLPATGDLEHIAPQQLSATSEMNGQQNGNIHWQQQQQQQHRSPDTSRIRQQPTRQPQTLVTASSDHSMTSLNEPNTFRRDSRHFSSSSAMLIPIPSDQIHLRRLSDQSNLMRRSSILAASAQEGLMIQRNRSHSEINAHQTNLFYHQPTAEASHLFTDGHFYQQQQYFRRMSDQQQHQHQILRGSQGHIQSIVTPYSQKLRYSSEEMRSDSSSDLEDGTPGHVFSNHPLNHHYSPAASQNIPSVSVSEFSSSQRSNQNQLYRDQMEQVNAAVEEAIMKQKRLMQHRNSLFEESISGQAANCRRTSTGRLLPKTPDEQSKSLLELPAHMRDSSSAGHTNSSSRLDLPCLSPTIRRASAPEGQNIKIVVDDIDGSLKQSSSALLSKQGQLYERLVLYRDHSLGEPNGNGARAFGLHVTGGKIIASSNNNAPDHKLQAYVSWTLPGGPADKVGLRVGDRIVEWDGKCLVDMTYEQVAEVIESSGNIAELLVRPLHKLEAHQSNYVRTQRRLSQQTERDMRRSQQQQQPDSSLPTASNHHSYNNRTSTQQTHRRLPQIPPANLELLPQADNYSSLGHLEQAHLLLNDRTIDPMHCLSARHDQQSRSATELTSTATRHGNPYSANTNNPSSIPTTASNQYYRLQSTATASNGHHHHHPHHKKQYTRHNAASAAATAQQNGDEFYGLIGLQVSVDESMAQLEFSILSATDVPANPCLEHHVRVRILPESLRFKPCFTHPSYDMNWKETFIFQDFPTQQIKGMSLEISIWIHEEIPRLSVQPAQPICETLIPIQSACEHNTDFWPLRAPACSPGARRKSLNDLIETSRKDVTSNWNNDTPLGIRNHQTYRPPQSRDMKPAPPRKRDYYPSESKIRRDELPIVVRRKERSGSNKNLPGSPRLLTQLRRASDEAMATSNSYRLSARLSPAQSRRAISVTNVGGDSVFSRPSSRLGSQGNLIMKKSGADGLPLTVTVHNSPGSTNLSSPTSQISVGMTPTGRRSSLIGIQSMSGYRSQKNSQSGSTDHELPTGRCSANQMRVQQHATSEKVSRRQNETSKSQPPSLSRRESHIDSATSSRKQSSEQSTPTLERKRSFAILTLRKLKRTMSLTKGGNDSNVESRRSSSSSCQSNELAEDAGVSRRLMAHQDCVGRLKLGLVMTKGQLELEVICAESVQINRENTLGIYVKVYLIGGGRSNKRKTRLVQPSEMPVFKQLIKYDGSLVDNKSLEVSMWQSQGNLKGKSPIGYTIIRLVELKLDQLQTVWYSLRPMDAVYSSSFEDS